MKQGNSHLIRLLKREKMYALILAGLSETVQDWGLKCLRYEIKDIKVTENVREVINMEGERSKKDIILHYEPKEIDFSKE